MMSVISQNARSKSETKREEVIKGEEVEDGQECDVDTLKEKKRKRDGKGEQLAIEQVREMKKLENFLFGSLYSPLEFGKRDDDEVEDATAGKASDLFFTDRSADSVLSVYQEGAELSDDSCDDDNAHVKLNPGTDWAQVDSGSKIDKSSDGELTDDENDAVVSRGYEDVDDILRTNEDLVVKSHSKLLPGHIEYSRLVDANIQDPSNGPINSVQFHRNAQLLLAAGLDRKLRFFQIDGKRNTKVESIFLEDCPIRKASFLPDGSQVILSARRKFFYNQHSSLHFLRWDTFCSWFRQWNS